MVALVKRFYRLETRDGSGIYQSLFTNEIYGNEFIENYSELHPPPQRDKILKDIWFTMSDRYDYKFGFDSIGQLRQWFSQKIIRNIIRAGKRRKIVLRVYRGEVIKGDRQSIIDSTSMELVKTLQLKVLLLAKSY